MAFKRSRVRSPSSPPIFEIIFSDIDSVSTDFFLQKIVGNANGKCNWINAG